jgi:hypothetical protein
MYDSKDAASFDPGFFIEKLTSNLLSALLSSVKNLSCWRCKLTRSSMELREEADVADDDSTSVKVVGFDDDAITVADDDTTDTAGPEAGAAAAKAVVGIEVGWEMAEVVCSTDAGFDPSARISFLACRFLLLI